MTPPAPAVLLLRRLRRLLDRTLDLDPTERESFLGRLAREEPSVAREVAALLALEPALDAACFLSGDAVDRRRAAALRLTGLPLGRYVLERPLSGSPGTVWLARRRGDRRGGLVPVEVFNLDRLAPTGEERLQQEGTLLGQLDDPQIARLLDAGVTGVGVPFLLLEFLRRSALELDLPEQRPGHLVAVLGSAARDRRNRPF